MLLGEKIDVMLQEYVEKLSQNGGVISINKSEDLATIQGHTGIVNTQ